VGDGTTWSLIPVSNYLNSVTYGNGQFVAVGNDGMILNSTDGTTWTRINSENMNSLFSVTYGNKEFVAVGDKGTILISKADPTEIAFQSKIKPQNKIFRINIEVRPLRWRLS
jgi:hypothetical protein